MIMNKVFRQSV